MTSLFVTSSFSLFMVGWLTNLFGKSVKFGNLRDKKWDANKALKVTALVLTE